MARLRDYEQWHEQYDDPESDLSWRLRTVQDLIRRVLDERQGAIRIVSACSGDGRDLLEVLAERQDATRASAILIEIQPSIAGRAIEAAAGTTANVEVRTLDAGFTDAYIGAVPADLVLLVGIFGNISESDLMRTVSASPQLCSPGATLLWSRGRRHVADLNAEIREQFGSVGFWELDYATLDRGSWPTVGALRYEGSPIPMKPGQRLFTFVR